MRISAYLIRELDHETFRKLYSLNLRKKGFSRGHFRDSRRENHRFSRVVIAWKGRIIAGWALMLQCLDEDGALREFSVNFYVRKALRMKRVGSILFDEVNAILNRDNAKGHVCIWDRNSEHFYTRKTSPRIRIIISPRYHPALSAA